MREHVLTDRLTFSGVCRDNRLYILSNRVQLRVYFFQIAPSYHSGNAFSAIGCALRRRCCARHTEIIRAVITICASMR